MGHSNYTENFDVVVHANCSQDGFFQAIFQTYNGTIDSADYIETRRANCSETVTFTKKGNVSHNVAIFPEMRYVGILTSIRTTTGPSTTTMNSMSVPNESHVCKYPLISTYFSLYHFCVFHFLGLIISIIMCVLLIIVIVIAFLVSYSTARLTK